MKRVLLGFMLSGLALAASDYPVELTKKSDILGYIFEMHDRDELDFIQFYTLKDELKSVQIEPMEQAILESVEISLTNAKDFKQIYFHELSVEESLKFISHGSIINKEHVRLSENAIRRIKETKHHIQDITKDSIPSVTQIRNLVADRSLLDQYLNGEYREAISLFLFCREDRDFPCRFVVKNRSGDLVREKNGKIWSLPALAKSARGIPYYKTNGQTPTGVHSIDSVMPTANRQRVFGKFRRLIMNWIPKENNRELALELLPANHKTSKWWMQASVARDAGRKYLRVHGTGRVNSDRNASYYPHMPTSGCISTREGRYDGIEYIDQRVILDKLMEASSLLPSFENETDLKGILYVINIDKKKSPVTLDDLSLFGIR